MEYPLGVKFRYEDQPLLIELDDIYSEDECRNFIKRIDSLTPTLATNNAMYRNQDRVMVDDKDISEDLFNRILPSLPEKIEQFELYRLNERLRFYRYMPGQKFEPHMDHWYQASQNEISLYSVLVYFNGNFDGGETRFMEQLESTATPKAGKVVIFQHKIRHEGCLVVSGTKYAVRTDVMYKKS